MRLKGIIARVLAIILSVQLAVGPVFAGARGIGVSSDFSIESQGGKPLIPGFGSGNLSLGNILDGAIDGVIRSGINSAVYGTDFLDGLSSSLASTVVNLTLADVQFEIGEFGKGIDNWEGSFGHATLHGLAGCISAELTGADCHAGAAGAIAQSLYAGAVARNGREPDPNDYTSAESYRAAHTAWRARNSQIAELIGALAGFTFSGGKAENVSSAANIAQSGFDNNYLTHSELVQFERALRACMADGGDCTAVIAEYRALSELHDAELRACGANQACIERHLIRIAAADISGKADDVLNLIRLSGTTSGWADTFERLQYETALAVSDGADWDNIWENAGTEFRSEFEITSCDGLSGAACQAAFDTEIARLAADAARRKANHEALVAFFEGVGILIDFVPVLGDIKGGIECAADVSWSTCGAAIAGILPVLGDGAGVVVKRGDDVFLAGRQGGEIETTPLDADQWEALSDNADALEDGGSGLWDDIAEVGRNRGLCSFHGDTLVALEGDKLLPIRDVDTTMRVASRNPETGEVAYKQVIAQYSNQYEETIHVTVRDEETGAMQTIVSNRIHPFFVQLPQSKARLQPVMQGGAADIPPSSEGHVYTGPIRDGHWVDAADLKPGYRLLNPDQTWAEVVSVEIEAKPLKAYNLTVADFHTYFVAANDNSAPVWVHNDCLSSVRWKGFSRGSAGSHFEKHGSNVGATNTADYIGKARNFAKLEADGTDILASPVSGTNFVVKVQKSTGHVLIGRKNSREFATYYKNDGRVNSDQLLDAAVQRAREISQGLRN